MDPVELVHLRMAIQQQGILLGTHQQDLQQIAQNLATLSNSLNLLTTQVQHFQAVPTPAQPPPTSAPATTFLREPRLPVPQPYDGEPG
ncbi:uncharacterized protein LOC132868895 isoform X3 [Neoarius graeffei]|uniref:uncharacterized protein LOC132868895 isoform X3 n=1 Tax=Neoarius graeffei TaxID=443677 RepID=UPI00298C437D|nr:uncharacterized protein LOC132868895 isoform X3 [Neoarius graeffei]